MTRMLMWRLFANVYVWAWRRAVRVVAVSTMLLPLFFDDPRAVSVGTAMRRERWTVDVIDFEFRRGMIYAAERMARA